MTEDTLPAALSAPRRPSPGIAQSLALLVIFYVFIIAANLLFAPIQSLAGIKLDLFTSLLIMQALAWPVTIGLGLQWARVPFKVAYPFTPFPPRIIPALAVAFFGLAILSIALASLIPMPESLRVSLTESAKDSPRLAGFLAAVVIAPLTEEMFFRGLLLRSFLGRYSRRKAVWATALIFALFHLNPWQAVVAVPTGLALAWLFLRTGSLIPCILGHAAVNFSASYLLTPLGKLMGYDAAAFEALKYWPPSILAVGVAALLVGGFVLRRQLDGIAPAGSGEEPVSEPVPILLPADEPIGPDA